MKMILIRKFCLTLCAVFSIMICPLLAQQADKPVVQTEPVEFTLVPAEPRAPEVWGYMVGGSENGYTGNEPITDLCYFRAVLNYKGELHDAVSIPVSVRIKEGVRRHLVVAELSNSALVHFTLADSNVRTKLVEDILKCSENFDGVQIDFESVHSDDKAQYFSFLKEIKGKIGTKILSVAVPARTRFVDDAYNYETLSAIVDRLIVMAYDEHWKNSAPGPVASIGWCEKVALYTKTRIPPEKLVMGVPLYGRSWQTKSYDKSVKDSDARKIAKNRAVKRDPKHPSLVYDQKVRVVVYFENAVSIMKKVRLYRSNGIESVAFWRLGQGPSEIWKLLKKESSQKKTPLVK